MAEMAEVAFRIVHADLAGGGPWIEVAKRTVATPDNVPGPVLNPQAVVALAVEESGVIGSAQIARHVLGHGDQQSYASAGE